MPTLCTFPGRAGDLLWALPTVRAIAEAVGDPVDLQISGEFATLVPLLDRQPYLWAVHADPGWNLSDWRERGMEHDWEPPVVEGYDQVIHLGYRRWPELPLPYETFHTAVEHAPLPLLPAVDLTRPWIEAPFPPEWTGMPLTLGFTECHFETKVGLLALLQGRVQPEDGFLAYMLAAPGSRWVKEADYDPIDWLEAAGRITASRVLLTDCSALHVLGVAVGTPVVCVEPMEARWNPIFWPLGQDGPQVTLVKGHDHRPTVDARHVGEVLEQRLKETR
jgi:hypothetical protein